MPKLHIKKPTPPATTLISFKAREHRDHPADGPSLAYECDVCHHRAATKHGLRSHFDRICFPNRRRSHPLFLSRSKMITSEQIVLLNCEMPFRFMDLPPEIRLRIYGYIFIPRGPIRIKEIEAIVDGILGKRFVGLYNEEQDCASQVRCFEFGSASSILTVSKAIHREAIEILYRGVTFAFDSRIGRFFSTIGPTQQSNITDIRLSYTSGGPSFLRSIRNFLGSTPRLTRLSFNFSHFNLQRILEYHDQFKAFPRLPECPRVPPHNRTRDVAWEVYGLYRTVRLCFGQAAELSDGPKQLQVLELAGQPWRDNFAPINLVRSSTQLKKWQGDGGCASFMASDLDGPLEELIGRYRRSES